MSRFVACSRSVPVVRGSPVGTIDDPLENRRENVDESGRLVVDVPQDRTGPTGERHHQDEHDKGALDDRARQDSRGDIDKV